MQTHLLAHCDCKECLSICIGSCRSIVSSVSTPIKIFVCLLKKKDHDWEKNRYTAYGQTNSISDLSMELLQLFVNKNLCCCFCVWVLQIYFNPLTPVPSVTGRDEPWVFSHFWCHHFWPKLALSILKFCRRKRSLQWCQDQTDWPNGAWEMHKNAQKVDWKTQSKISSHLTPWCSMLKIARLDDAFLEVF